MPSHTKTRTGPKEWPATQKYNLRLFGAGPSEGEPPQPEELIPIFHRWIQEERLQDRLIDVADYRHVPGGPGVLLIGHDAQYGYELVAGRPALLYSRRRETHPAVSFLASSEERLRSVFDSALEVARLLTEEPELAGRLSFPGDRWRLEINDRLAAANDEAARQQLLDLLRPLLGDLFPGREWELPHHEDQDPRGLLRVSCGSISQAESGVLCEELDAVAGGA